MKKLFLSFMAFAAMATMCTLTSCSDDENGADTGGGSEEELVLAGTISGSRSLEAKEYILDGSLIVENGGVLTIPAGTTIKARKGFSNYVLVLQGGKINAEGTAANPIIFTADDDNATSGYWGGIIINGKAPISGDNEDASQCIGLTEINNAYTYGGNVANDNSGVLKYVEICYAGARSTADIEHNGLTLNGVGNGTTIENIYVLESADDAIEFFGGTVNVTNLLAVNPDDDMFDFTQGYSGTLKNCYGIWESAYTSTESDPRGVEADGNLDGNGADHFRQSDFRIENMTIVSNAADRTEKVDRMDDAIKIRRGAKATIANALIAGTGGTKDLIDMTDSKGAGNAESSISYTVASTFTIHGAEVNGDATTGNATTHTGADTSAFSWVGYTFPTLAQ